MPTTKTCAVCGMTLPADQFRFRRAAGLARERRCRRCYATYMRQFRAQKRSAALQKFASAVAKEQSIRRIEQLCSSMFRRFGGVEGFATLWAAEIKAAAASDKGKSRAIKGMLATLHLQGMVQSHEPGNPYAQLTDDELREVMQHKFHELLRDPP